VLGWASEKVLLVKNLSVDFNSREVIYSIRIDGSMKQEIIKANFLTMVP